MRLVIGGPTLAMAPASFAQDLAWLFAKTRECGPWGSDVVPDFWPATYVHLGRERVLERALANRATHLLWLDTDMAFPPETANWLAQHDVPMVGCNCVMRDPRLLCTAQRHGQRIETRQESTGLEAVDAVGLAVMLMRTDIVAGLERPWFTHGRTEAGEDIGEDLMFCRALRAAGHEIYIDHDLSKEIGHVGQHSYRIPARAPVTV